MKLNKELTDFIQKVLNIANSITIVDVTAEMGLIFESGRIRGMSEDQTVVLFQEEGIPEFEEIGSIGLNRTDVFSSRLNMVREQEGFSLVATNSVDDLFVRNFTLKAKGTKLEYRCANPATIKAPRVFNDTIVVSVDYASESVSMLQKGFEAYGKPEVVTITSDDEGISFELQDVGHDLFKHTFNEVTEHQFSHKYPTKTLLSLFKKKREGTFDIGQKGTFRFDVGGIGVYVLPKV